MGAPSGHRPGTGYVRRSRRGPPRSPPPSWPRSGERRPGPSDQLGDLGGRGVGVGLREIDLVHDRQKLELVLDRKVGVGDGLGLDALSGVDHEHRSLAGLQGAGNLVGEVDVPGRVDQVELVALPLHPHGLRLDRDAPLALEVHRVEDLRAHIAVGDGVRELEDPVGQGGFPVVDVGDDREVANAVLGHGLAALQAVSQR